MSGKRYTKAKTLLEKKTYTLTEAVEIVKKNATAKFDESIEIHARMGIDPSKGDQQLRTTISFPHGVGKTKRVIAFVEPAKEEEAKAAGADIIGNEETIATIAQKGAIDFDVAVATPAMMPKLAKLAKILGPRGLMPNPKTDTVSTNVQKMVAEQKAGKQTFKNDKGGNIHQIVGRASFEAIQLEENIRAFVELLRKIKPSAAKGIYIRSLTLTSTMGPGIHIDISASF